MRTTRVTRSYRFGALDEVRDESVLVHRGCNDEDGRVRLAALERPLAQTPGWPVLQAIPPPGLPSSGTPSQSSSSPLHVSTVAWTFWLHWICPPEQLVVPAAQMVVSDHDVPPRQRSAHPKWTCLPLIETVSSLVMAARLERLLH